MNLFKYKTYSISAASTEEVLKLAQSSGKILESGDEDEIRFSNEELIDRIIIDNEHVKIEWKFVFDVSFEVYIQ